ncbi:hypothetical protein E4U42_004384, partial [Claviceps africana]
MNRLVRVVPRIRPASASASASASALPSPPAEMTPRSPARLRPGSRGFASTEGRRERVAFVGLGQMDNPAESPLPQGHQMARNLQSKLQPTDALSIFDINAQAMSRLDSEARSAEGGAKVELARSAQAASREADIVVTVLPGPDHVRDAYACMLEGSCPRRRIFIDCSTIDPSTSRSVARTVAASRA